MRVIELTEPGSEDGPTIVIVEHIVFIRPCALGAGVGTLVTLSTGGVLHVDCSPEYVLARISCARELRWAPGHADA